MTKKAPLSGGALGLGVIKQLQSFLNASRTDAASACLYGLQAAVAYGTNFLKVGVPYGTGFVVCVADIIAEAGAFSTDIAFT